MNKALMLGLIAVVSAALIGGFMAVGGPGYARLERQDAKRARDLQAIVSFLVCRTEEKVLPQALEDDDYCPERTVVTDFEDDVTGVPYEYRRLDDTHFEVCAIFETDPQDGARMYLFNSIKFDGQVGCRSGEVLARNTRLNPTDQFVVTPLE